MMFLKFWRKGKMNKTNDNQLLITVSSFDDFMKCTRNAFKRVEAGLPPKKPINRLSFTSQADLFKTLSPKRMELMRFLKKNGPLSRRQLSIKLNRAYANVHADIKVLFPLGLVKKNREQKLFVPWDEINIAMQLAA